MKKLIFGIFIIAAISISASFTMAQLPAKRVLTLEAAKTIAAAAEAEAIKRGSTVVIVIVDDGGQVVLLERKGSTIHRSQVSRSASEKLVRRRSFGGQARTSKTRSRMAVSRLWH